MALVESLASAAERYPARPTRFIRGGAIEKYKRGAERAT
jgi:hypothetical protein